MTYATDTTLIPAEVQPKRYRRPETPGFTVDREGLNNNHALMPKMSYAEFPSPEQQRRYLLQGAIALGVVGPFIATALVAANWL